MRVPRGTGALTVVLLATLGAGYVVGDLYDLVPGRFTLAPVPEDPDPFPTAPAAAGPADLATALEPLSDVAPVPLEAHVAELVTDLASNERLGICIDSCHLFAAGYPLASAAEYDGTMEQFDRTVGLDRVRAFHLNDSKRPLGSRVDRHEHIGEGQLGLTPFRRILNDPRFADLPMYLETPKGERDGRDLDATNLATLRSLLRPARRARAAGARTRAS